MCLFKLASRPRNDLLCVVWDSFTQSGIYLKKQTKMISL